VVVVKPHAVTTPEALTVIKDVTLIFISLVSSRSGCLVTEEQNLCVVVTGSNPEAEIPI